MDSKLKFYLKLYVYFQTKNTWAKFEKALDVRRKMRAKYVQSQESSDLNAYFICYNTMDSEVFAPFFDNFLQQERLFLPARVVEAMVELGDIGRITRSYRYNILRLERNAQHSLPRQRAYALHELNRLRTEMAQKLKMAKENTYKPSKFMSQK